MGSKRLFIGLAFSPHLSRDLEPWVKKMRKTADRLDITLRWTPPENYHTTLVFLGDTPQEETATIQGKMAEVALRHSRFSLKLREISGFPHPSQARVLYLGVQRSQAILNLQSDLEKSLNRPEETDYRPHLTLARLRNPRSCRDLLSPFRHVDLGRQEVNEIILFQSVLTGPFPVYQKLFSASLVTGEQGETTELEIRNSTKFP